MNALFPRPEEEVDREAAPVVRHATSGLELPTNRFGSQPMTYHHLASYMCFLAFGQQAPFNHGDFVPGQPPKTQWLPQLQEIGIRFYGFSPVKPDQQDLPVSRNYEYARPSLVNHLASALQKCEILQCMPKRARATNLFNVTFEKWHVLATETNHAVRTAISSNSANPDVSAYQQSFRLFVNTFGINPDASFPPTLWTAYKEAFMTPASTYERKILGYTSFWRRVFATFDWTKAVHKAIFAHRHALYKTLTLSGQWILILALTLAVPNETVPFVPHTVGAPFSRAAKATNLTIANSIGKRSRDQCFTTLERATLLRGNHLRWCPFLWGLA